jgi:hypothetical protein
MIIGKKSCSIFKWVAAVFVLMTFGVTGCSDSSSDNDATSVTDNGSSSISPTAENPEPVPEYVRTHTLGEFQITGGKPDHERGWRSDGVDNLESPHTVSDLTGSRYLIFEFDRAVPGEFQFVWLGSSNGWSWTPTEGFTADDDTLIFDIRTIDGYREFIECEEVKIFICYHDGSWDDFVISDVYLAN